MTKLKINDGRCVMYIALGFSELADIRTKIATCRQHIQIFIGELYVGTRPVET